MTIDPATLLRSLGSGVLPPSIGQAQQAAPIGGSSFDQMLQQAQDGTISSGIPVRVSQNAGVSLSGSQLTRLADAADRAEAAGASRALVMIDGKALTMDVAQRTITGTADLNSTKVLSGVDAVVTVAPPAGDLPGQASLPASSTMNASLLKILAGLKPATGTAG